MTSAITALLRREGASSVPIEISVVLCADHFIRDLNREHRGFDKATDVLSFPQEDVEDDSPTFPGQPDDLIVDASRVLGDVVISLQTADVQARAAGWSIEDEVDLLAIHGVLHLLGYDDETVEGAAEMREISAQVLKDVAIELPAGDIHPYFIEYSGHMV